MKAVTLFLLGMLFTGITTKVSAQLYSAVDVVTASGRTAFSYNEVPDPIIPLVPALLGTAYQWYSSATPFGTLTAIPGATQATLTLTQPLQETTYFTRRITLGLVAQFYSKPVKIEVVSVNWEDLSYVREHDVLVPGMTDWKVIDQLAIGEKLQTTTYMDGLGRTIQQVDRGMATPNDAQPNLWGDVVQFYEYNALGQRPRQYLAYTTTTEPGKFRSNPYIEQLQYYSNAYGETHPYINSSFENSPLKRPVTVKSAGTSWANSSGNSFSYDLNEAGENVRIFTIGFNTGDLPASPGAYPSNTLFKYTHTDENGKELIEYVNKLGQMILTKVQIDDNPSNQHQGWICTYNVFDAFGTLRFSIPAEAVKYLDANAWSFAGSNGELVAHDLCSRYEYDEKGRNVLKKAPGSDEVLTLYDQRDRIVFIQDANQRAKSPAEWLVNLYDESDRPVITALYLTNKTVAELQSDIDNAAIASSVTINNGSSPINDLIVDKRDQNIISYAAINSVEIISGFESPANDEFTVEINPSAVTPPLNISTVTYTDPISESDLNNPAVTTILKYFFYDSYSFETAEPFHSDFDNNLAYVNGEPIEATQRVLSKSTGTLVRILGTANFLASTYHYDEKGRSIQTIEENVKSGKDITTLQYAFDNRLLSTNVKHTTAATGYSHYSIVTKNIFDQIGRVSAVEKKFGSNEFRTIVSLEKDDMGRVKTKLFAPGSTVSGKNELESLTYSYNIYNQINGINKDYALKTPGMYSKWGNFFGMYLGYDNADGVFANSILNGQVSGVLWNTQGDDVQRKFDFVYDNAGRLINALYNERQTSGDSWSNAKMDFSVTGSSGKIDYDLNGNLLGLLRKGVVPGAPTPVDVDNLAYSYASYSNKVIKVVDNSTLGANNGKLGDFTDGGNGANADYDYDNNGNLVEDFNKNFKDIGGVAGADGIRYNFLNKPEEIRITGRGVIKIVYDADGNKLQKSFTPEGASTAVETTYSGAFVYKGNELRYLIFEEGVIRVVNAVNQNNGYDYLNIDGNIDLPGGKRGVFDYFVRDNQSNLRMILTEQTHSGGNTCTMETFRAANEESIFGKVDANGNPATGNEVQARFPVNSIPGQTTGNGWQNSNIGNHVSRISNLAGNKIGPNTLLKVMAGDEVSATTIYYYQNPVVNQSGNTILLNDLLLSLTQAIAGGPVTSGATKNAASDITSLLNTSIPFSSAVAPDANNASGNNPKAYLAVMFFDERFNFVSEGSITARVVQAGNGASPLVLANIKAPKNGYAYVYVSNESDEIVYFDNLQVSHQRGCILEENHYYPYGLKIAALSSSKLYDPTGNFKNIYKYQSDFSDFDEDLGYNEFFLRDYDPQLARWIQQDPKREFPSPYLGMGNDPVNNVDPDGGGIFEGMNLFQKTLIGVVGGGIIGGTAGLILDEDNAWAYAGWGALLGGTAVFASVTPLHPNLYLGPSWSLVKDDIRGHGKLGSAYLGSFVKSLFMEVLSLGKVVTVRGDSETSLNQKVNNYFKNHPDASTIGNFIVEFHNGAYGNSSLDTSSFLSIKQHFNGNSTILLGNCFAGRDYNLDNFSKITGGATVIGHYSYQNDLTFLMHGSLTGGNPKVMGKSWLIKDEMFVHDIAQGGKIVEKGVLLTTHISNAGNITYRKLSQQRVNKLINRWSKMNSKFMMILESIFLPTN